MAGADTDYWADGRTGRAPLAPPLPWDAAPGWSLLGALPSPTPASWERKEGGRKENGRERIEGAGKRLEKDSSEEGRAGYNEEGREESRTT